MDIFKSKPTTLSCGIECVYAKLAYPESFNSLIERLPDEAKSKFGKAKFDNDSITIEANPVGEIKLNIAERVEPTRVVFAAAQSPVPLQIVITLEKAGENETIANAELNVELNPFIRPMLSKPLQDGADKFGELLAKLPFNMM